MHLKYKRANFSPGRRHPFLDGRAKEHMYDKPTCYSRLRPSWPLMKLYRHMIFKPEHLLANPPCSWIYAYIFPILHS